MWLCLPVQDHILMTMLMNVYVYDVYVLCMQKVYDTTIFYNSP